VGFFRLPLRREHPAAKSHDLRVDPRSRGAAQLTLGATVHGVADAPRSLAGRACRWAWGLMSYPVYAFNLRGGRVAVAPRLRGVRSHSLGAPRMGMGEVPRPAELQTARMASPDSAST